MKVGIRTYSSDGRNRQGLQLDVAFIISQLFTTFPSIVFEEEYFQRQVEEIEELRQSRDIGNAKSIAERDALERGPGFRFNFFENENYCFRGLLTRYSLSFEYQESIDPDLERKLSEFVGSFGLEVTSS